MCYTDKEFSRKEHKRMPIVEIPEENLDCGNEIYESEDSREKNALAWLWNAIFRRP